MELISKFSYELNIEVIENRERINFVNRDMEQNYRDNDIDKNSINSFGYFFVNLLNKRNDIVLFFDKLSQNISSTTLSIYDNWRYIALELLKTESYIDNDFIPFYLHYIDKKMSENFTFHKGYEEELKKIHDSEKYFENLLISEEDLNKAWKNDKLANDFSDLKSYKKYIEERIHFNQTYKGYNQQMRDKYSSEQVIKDIVSEIEQDKNRFIECIDILEFYLDIDRKNYTKNQIEFMNREMLIPRCRKVLCFIKDNVYYRYSSITRKMKNISIEKIENIGNSISMNIYEINSINELLDLYVGFFVDNSIDLRKCDNCGKYFVSENGTKYCNNISPQDKNKKCIEIGSKYKYSNKEIAKKYSTIVNRYRSKRSHTTKNKEKEQYQKELELFRKEYEKLKKSRINEEDLEKWLDNKIIEYDKKYRSK